jgi:hypothetical protein
MSSLLQLLLTFVPMIPKLIETGQATLALYDNVRKVIDEHRKPNEPEWNDLETMIARDQAIVRDRSRDV